MSRRGNLSGIWCLVGTAIAVVVAMVLAVIPSAAAQAASTPVSSTHLNSLAATPTGRGYWEVADDGGVFSFGDARFYGSMGGKRLNAPVVGIAATPTGRGYWLTASDGGIFAFGDARFYGSMGGKRLNAPVVGIARTPSGRGYWLTASDGGVFSFGDARFYGSMGGKRMNAPVVGIASSATGRGYWLTASDGGVFAFGDARFAGSMGGSRLNAPVVGIAATPTGRGYWLTASDGGVFSFGDAAFYGSMGGKEIAAPVTGIAANPRGGGYWLVAQDGGIFAFGRSLYYGRAAYTPPIASLPRGARELAAKVLATRSVSLVSVHPSGRVDNATARQNLIDVSNGRVAHRSSYSQAGRTAPGGTTSIQPLVLQILLTASAQHTITVSEIAGGVHTGGSYHYSGRAIDISRIDGQVITGRDSRSLAVIAAVSPLLPTGSAIGQAGCGGGSPRLPAGVKQIGDSCDHLHIQLP